MSADFTPPLKPYSDINKFKFWCQKVLPIVYDDSLSYYEVLNKVVNYLNEVIENMDNVEDNVKSIYDAFVELQDYVNEYFDNQDWQSMVNNKIDQLIIEGYFEEIIEPLVTEDFNRIVLEFNEFKEEVNDDIDDFKQDVNDDLQTQNENISVLVARMDTFASLPDGSTAGDAELLDIRVGANGVTYSSAGAAVRGQVGELNSSLTFPFTDTSLFEGGSISSTDGTNTNSAYFVRTKTYIDKSIKIIRPLTGYEIKLLAYSNGAYVGTWNGTSYGTTAVSLTGSFCLPLLGNYDYKVALKKTNGNMIDVNDATNLVFYKATDTTLTKKGEAADAKETGDIILSEDNYIKRIATKYTTLTLSDIEWIDNYYLTINNAPTAADGYRYSNPIEVKSGDSVTYTITSINNIAVALAAYDRDLNYIKSESIYYDSEYASGSLVTFTGTYVVPQNVRYIKICQKISTSGQSVSIPCFISIPSDNEKRIDVIEHDIEALDLSNQWYNKKWVAFGTSITDNWSEYSYITHGDHAGEHTGKYVPYLLDMSELSSNTFVNRGIAGGSINGHILYYLRYYTANMADADLITIEGSVNDFAVGIPLGSVGDTVPYTNDLLPDSSASGTFAGACYQAFTTAITNAPNAVIVFLTDTTGKGDGYENYSQTRTNSLGLYQIDYINMAISVAKFVGIPVIECGSRSMINAQNPDYIADHIHHTYLGGYQYAKTIWSELKNIPLKALSIPE